MSVEFEEFVETAVKRVLEKKQHSRLQIKPKLKANNEVKLELQLNMAPHTHHNNNGDK